MNAPLRASDSLLAAITRKGWTSQRDIDLARWSDAQATSAPSDQSSTATIIDLALRMGHARQRRELHALGAASWSAVIEGKISEADCEALMAAKTRRDDTIAHNGEMHGLQFGVPKYRAYDHGRARERRGDLISMGLMPRSIRMILTPGEQAVAAIYAEDYLSKARRDDSGRFIVGRTDDAKDYIGQRAGTCRRVALRAQRALVEAKAIRITKQTRPGRRGFHTIVEIIDWTWLLWLRNRRVPKARSCATQKCDRPVAEYLPRDINESLQLVEKPQSGIRRGEHQGQAPPKAGSPCRSRKSRRQDDGSLAANS